MIRANSIRRRTVAGLPLLLLPLLAPAAPPADPARLHREMAALALPMGGYQSKVALGDSIVALTRAGVIDRKKFETLYAKDGAAREKLAEILDKPSHRPILITPRNARLYVNLLWPLGLANRMASNSASMLNGPSRSTFASTGGWNLGKRAEGGSYFNAFPIVELTAKQEALVTKIAQHSFRPCCDNSTFHQDCNHGSALLGLLALGASQGLGEDELYREALAFNSFWFPEQYTQIAIYFKVVKGVEWRNVDAGAALSAKYSSGSGMQANVARELQIRGLLTPQGGTDCST
jgi:hypothetical protein